jgi:hypothetical protein
VPCALTSAGETMKNTTAKIHFPVPRFIFVPPASTSHAKRFPATIRSHSIRISKSLPNCGRSTK